MIYQKLRLHLTLLVSLAAGSATAAPPTFIVYDGLTNATTLGGALSLETGASLELAGDARIITRIDVLTSSSISPESYRLLFHAVDSAGFPIHRLWTSNSMVRTGTGSQIMTINVPNLYLPDRFGWSIERLNGAGNTQLLQRFTTEPSVGTTIAKYWRDTGGYTPVGGTSAASFGARIYATVPEPGTGSLIFLAMIVFVTVERTGRRRTTG